MIHFFVAFLTIFLLGAPFARAHSIAGEPAGFTASFLISDSNFINNNSMNASAINSFLAGQGSWLANYTIPEYIDVPYFCYNTSNGNNEIRVATGVRQIHANGTTPLYGMRVADLLAERAGTIGLNPQVILTLFQRESSAITRSAPSSDTTRAWPLFYGFNDTMKNFQYTCQSGTAEQLARDYGGLGQQIAYATFSLRNRYNNANDYQTSSCSWSGGSVTDNGACFTVDNRASRALYVYTPAVHTGNHNFWYYYQTWFSSTVISQPLPNFRAIKGVTNPDIFLHDMNGNYKYRFQGMPDYYGWGFQNGDIWTLSDAEATSIPTVGEATRLIRTPDSNAVYIIDDGNKRHVLNEGAFAAFGVSWNDLTTIGNGLFAQTRYGAPIAFPARGGGDSSVFLLSDGRKWHIPNAFVFNSWGFSWSGIDTVPDSLYTQFSLGTLEIIMKGAGTPHVYAMSGGKRYYIPDGPTFNHFGFSWGNLATVGEETKNSFPEGPVLSRLVKGSGPQVYIIENSRKRYVTSSAALSRAGFSWSQLIHISDDLLNIYPQGTTVN